MGDLLSIHPFENCLDAIESLNKYLPNLAACDKHGQVGHPWKEKNNWNVAQWCYVLWTHQTREMAQNQIFELFLELSVEFSLYLSACNEVHNSGISPDLDQTAEMIHILSPSPEFVGQCALFEYILQYYKYRFEVRGDFGPHIMINHNKCHTQSNFIIPFPMACAEMQLFFCDLFSFLFIRPPHIFSIFFLLRIKETLKSLFHCFYLSYAWVVYRRSYLLFLEWIIVLFSSFRFMTFGICFSFHGGGFYRSGLC